MARRVLSEHGHPDAHIYSVETLGDGMLTEILATLPHGETPGRRVAVTARAWSSGELEVVPGWPA